MERERLEDEVRENGKVEVRERESMGWGERERAGG